MLSPDNSELYLCPTNYRLSDKGARPAGPVRRDPTKTEFMARRHDFNYQIPSIGNNYNQVVETINTHFSSAKILKIASRKRKVTTQRCKLSLR